MPSSFETVGHIAHLNIRDDLAPYKAVIGQVVLDKNAHIRTVVNKLGSINNQYRVFEMEVVAGEERFETEVVQFKARFKLDFSKVPAAASTPPRPFASRAFLPAACGRPAHGGRREGHGLVAGPGRHALFRKYYDYLCYAHRCTGTPGWSTSTCASSPASGLATSFWT